MLELEKFSEAFTSAGLIGAACAKNWKFYSISSQNSLFSKKKGNSSSADADREGAHASMPWGVPPSYANTGAGGKGRGSGSVPEIFK